MEGIWDRVIIPYILPICAWAYLSWLALGDTPAPAIVAFIGLLGWPLIALSRSHAKAMAYKEMRENQRCEHLP